MRARHRKHRWTRARERTGSPVALVAGVTVAVGAAALLLTLIPSGRRYMRLRAM